MNTEGNNKRRWIIIALVSVAMIVMAVMYFNKEETPYTSSSRKGDRVYLDILSIIPTQGIYTEGQVYYTEFVCECETTDHEEVKVFISSADYRRIFDADVNVIVSDFSFAERTKYSPAARIHGTVRSPQTLSSALLTEEFEDIIAFRSIDVPKQYKVN